MQYCHAYFIIKKQMQKGGDLPRFTQLTNGRERIQAQLVYHQSSCFSLSIRMGAEQPDVIEKGWGDTAEVVRNSILIKATAIPAPECKALRQWMFLAHSSVYFPFLMLSTVYSQGENLGRGCIHGLLDILKRYTSAAHTHNVAWTM